LARPWASRGLLGRLLARLAIAERTAVVWLRRMVPLALDVALPGLFLWIMAGGWWAVALEWFWTYIHDALDAWRLLDWQQAAWNAYQPVVMALVVLALARRPLRFALAVSAVLFMLIQTAGEALERSRTFFGVYTIAEIARPTATYRFLYHGRTNHGGQILDQPRRGVTYYTHQGPVGQMFLAHRRSELPLRRVAVTGLGVGALACHVEPGPERSLVYFEIDPEVERLARTHFEYLSACGENLVVEIGDGRLAMAAQVDGAFDLIILDAFAGDAVPAHLLTREAFELYLRKLSPTGWLAVHITNSYVDLLPVVRATLAELKLAGRAVQWNDGYPILDFSYNSHWVVAARSTDQLQAFDRAATRWLPLEGAGDGRVWTDDFSNLFRALRWGEAGVFGR
jgi:hypothetical protein